MIFGLALLAPTLVRPLSAADRQAARAHPRALRPARAREREPPAAAHGDHRLGADDRRRARRAGGDLRRRPARDDRPGHRRAGAARPASSPTTTASRRCRSASPSALEQVDGVSAVSVAALRDGPDRRRAGQHGRDRHRRRHRARRADPQLGRGLRRRAVEPRRRTARRSATTSPSPTTSAVGDSVRFLTPRGNEVTYERAGHLRLGGRLRRRHRRQQRVARERLGRRRHRLRAGRRRAGRRPGGDQARRGEPAGGLPDRQADDDRRTSRTSRTSRSTCSSASSWRCSPCR